MSLTKLQARLCAVVLFSVGCGASTLSPVGASCPTPDGAAPVDVLPPADGAFAPHPDLPKGWAWITVEIGVLKDLDEAAGSNSAGDRLVGDKIRVMAGYGIDYVLVDHAGSLGPPGGEEAKGQPLVLSFAGHSEDTTDPTRPPHPDYAPARALFEALVNGPRTGNAEVGTRESPGGRIHCEVGQGVRYLASCSITGALEARF